MAGISNPGDFEIEEAVLITSRGMEVDLVKGQNINSITIWEDITQTHVSGQIFLHNAVALSSIGPIIGQEYLKLKIKTAGFVNSDTMVDYSENALTIYSVETRMDDKSGIELLILNFITSEQVINQRTKINRVLKGAYSDIVTDILKNDIDCRKDLYIEPTDGNKKIISPNSRPFDIIDMAATESISKEVKSSTFLFFETLRGYHFRSLDSLYIIGPQLRYDAFSDAGLKVHKTGSAKGSVDIEAGFTSIMDYEIINGSDSLLNYTLGTYGSKLIVHDIFNKNYQEFEYNMLKNFDNEHHIEYYNTGRETPIYNSTMVDEENRSVSDFPARTFVTPTSLKDDTVYTDATHHTSENNHPFAAQKSHAWLQRRNSQMRQLETGFLINTLVLGNTVISAGDVVMLDLPLPLADSIQFTDRDDNLDSFYKGAFLIKRIRHDFNHGAGLHETRMILVKDSITEILDNSGPPEPKGKGGTLTTDFYQNLGLAQLGQWL